MLKPLLAYIREHSLVRAGDRLGVAVSGGADSVALLRALLMLREELGVLVSVVHVHHGIRGAEADADAEFVSSLADEHGLALHLLHADVPAYAAKHGLSLEAAGRAVRYRYFGELLSKMLDRLATAHTRDDQAETVLLRLLRGAGTRGLAGVYSDVIVADSACQTTPLKRNARLSGPPAKPAFGLSGVVALAPHIIRPLLDTSRSEVEAFLRELGQPWREDSSNADRAFLRNRVRHELLPTLERDFNPNVRQVLAQTADVARDEEEWWAAEVAEILNSHLEKDDADSFPVPAFAGLHVAMQRRVLRAMAEDAGEPLGFDAIEGARAAILAGTVGTWPITGSLTLHLQRFRLADSRFFFQISPPVGQTQESLYEYDLPVPGRIDVPELGIRIRAVSVPSQAEGELSASVAGRTLRLRNWRAGDRFHAQGRGGDKKIKELFQIYRIPAADRARWPVLECDGEIVWVRGLPPSEKWGPRPGEEFSILLDTVPLSDTESA